MTRSRRLADRRYCRYTTSETGRQTALADDRSIAQQSIDDVHLLLRCRQWRNRQWRDNCLDSGVLTTDNAALNLNTAQRDRPISQICRSCETITLIGNVLPVMTRCWIVNAEQERQALREQSLISGCGHVMQVDFIKNCGNDSRCDSKLSVRGILQLDRFVYSSTACPTVCSLLLLLLSCVVHSGQMNE